MPNKFEQSVLDDHEEVMSFINENKELINKIKYLENSYCDLSIGEIHVGLDIMTVLVDILGFKFEVPEDVWRNLS